MMKILIKKFIMGLSLYSLLFSSVAYSQDDAAAGGGGDDYLKDGMNDIYVVVGAGAGGAILGLSTLSFVEEPGDHLKNIVVGLSIGVIIGVGVVAWQQATKSKDTYQDQTFAPKPEFSTGSRVSWHETNFHKYQKKQLQTFNYSFSF